MNRGYFADISELKKHGGKVHVEFSLLKSLQPAVYFAIDACGAIAS